MKLVGLASVVTALAVAVAGCGGSESSENASSPSAQAAPSGQPRQLDQDTFSQFQHCLEENGVTLPNRGQRGEPPTGQQGGGPPAIGEEARQAFEACGESLPSRPQGQGDFGFND